MSEPDPLQRLLSAAAGGKAAESEARLVLVAADGRMSTGDSVRGVAVLPGSFNPLHSGHERLAEVVSGQLGVEVVFELSVVNVDKPPLPEAELRRRLRQFRDRARVALTRAPTFVEKTRLFPGCTFVIGWDTAVRLVDPRYYGDDEAAMNDALAEMGAADCRFARRRAPARGRVPHAARCGGAVAVRGAVRGDPGVPFQGRHLLDRAAGRVGGAPPPADFVAISYNCESSQKESPMSCELQTRRVLRETGRRVTSPRLRVASVLRHAGGHRTAEQIHEQVQRGDPDSTISLSTVYRTLDTLEQMRLVSAIDERAGRAAYQWLDAEQPHHHLVCNSCGAEGALGGELFERLSAAIREQTGFEPFLDHFAISGLCRDCARAAADEPRR